MPPVSFPIKLWNIVNSCPSELMRWSSDGGQVLVNEERFDDLVDLYPSFLRQPTLYSLHRLFAVYEFQANRNCGENTGWVSYSHPYFVRGETDLLELYVLSHQTRRFNARKAKPDTDNVSDNCKRQRKVEGWCSVETLKRQFVAEIDSRNDLQVPVCSSSLFRFAVDVCLDVDSSADDQSLLIGRQRYWMTEENASADCSQIIDSEPADLDDGDVSFCGHETNTESSWMCQMSEGEEWFGLKDRPIAVPVLYDPLTDSEDEVDHTSPLSVTSYTDLLHVQLQDNAYCPLLSAAL